MYDWNKFYNFLQVDATNASAFLNLILNNKELFLDFYRNNPLGLDDKMLNKYAKKIFVKHLFERSDADVVEPLMSERSFRYSFFASNIENQAYNNFVCSRNEPLVSSEKELLLLSSAVLKSPVSTEEQKNKTILSIFEQYKQYIPKVKEENFEKFEYEYFIGLKQSGDFHDFYRLCKINGAAKEILSSLEGRLFYAGRHGCKNEVLINILKDEELLNTPKFKEYMFELMNAQKSDDQHLVYQNIGHFFKKRFSQPNCLELIETFIGVYKDALAKHIVVNKKNKKIVLTLENLISFWTNNDASMRDYSIVLSKVLLDKSIPKVEKSIGATKI